MDKATFTIAALHHAYAGPKVLANVDLAFGPGLLHGVVGPNGSGKSTLLALLSGNITPLSGEVRLNNTDVNEYPVSDWAKLCGLVPQDLDFNFPFTVFETVLMGRHPFIPRFARPSEHDLNLVDASLSYMDLNPLRDRVVADLSGGERQRVSVARGLAQETPALLLDEPTSALDIRHALSTMGELKRLAETGRTVITVLHDLNLAARFCDRVVMLDKGRVHAAGTPADTLTSDNIKTVFGVTASLFDTPTGQQICFTGDLS